MIICRGSRAGWLHAVLLVPSPLGPSLREGLLGAHKRLAERVHIFGDGRHAIVEMVHIGIVRHWHFVMDIVITPMQLLWTVLAALWY